PVREMPAQAGAEREREQEGRHREQVSHLRQHIARPRETLAYLDLRRRSLYGARPNCLGGAVSKRIVLSFLAVTAACSSSDNNALPSFVVRGSVVSTVYDGGSDDLLTGGLSATGLGGTPAPPAPGFADPANPTAAEL